MRVQPVLGVVVLVVLSGCLTGPTGQEGPVTVIVNNSANVTHTFEVRVVEYPSNVTVRRNDGDVATGSVGPGLATHEPGPYHFTAVDLHEPTRIHGRYTLAPGEEVRSNVTNFSAGHAVVVVISQQERIRAWITAHCDDDLVFLAVSMRSRGSGSSYNCEPGIFYRPSVGQVSRR